MFHPNLHIALVALGLGLCGMAAGANAAADDLSCRIASQTENGMTTIRGVLESPDPIEGTYRFDLRSAGNGGSNTISQGGAFSAQAGTALTLGQVTLNAGARTAIHFSISTGGRTIDCSDPLTLQS